MPLLVSARLESFEIYRLDGPSEVVLLVSLDLRFANDAMAWSEGMNDRFVTATRHGPQGHYLLEFATGP